MDIPADITGYELLALLYRCVRRVQPVLADNEQPHHLETNFRLDTALLAVEDFCRTGRISGLHIRAYSGSNKNLKRYSDLVCELVQLRGTLLAIENSEEQGTPDPYSAEHDIDSARISIVSACREILALEFSENFGLNFDEELTNDLDTWRTSDQSPDFIDSSETGLFCHLWHCELPADYASKSAIIDQQIVEAFDAEDRLLNRSRSRLNPEDMAREYIRDFQNINYDRTPNPCDFVERLLIESYDASLQLEEGRRTNFQLLFHDQTTPILSKFKTPLPFTNRNLVKLAPTIGLGFRYIVVASNGEAGKLQIVGISDEKLEEDVRSDPRRWTPGYQRSIGVDIVDLRIRVLGPGYIQLQDGIRIWELRDGVQSFFQPLTLVSYFRDWLISTGASLDSTSNTIPTILEVSFCKVIELMISASHGGAIILKNSTTDSNLDIKYPLDSNIFARSVKDRSDSQQLLPDGGIPDDSSSLETVIISERDLARTNDFVAALTAVDGATVIDNELTILGFGAEIDYEPLPGDTEVICMATFVGSLRGNRPVRKRKLNDFGMRHRSAFGYCRQHPEDMVLVVSQDGGLRLFCTDQETNQTILFENIAPVRRFWGMLRHPN